MSLGNKETMANNIKRLMALNQVNATDVCTALGFKAATFSDWVNAKTYPRIDKIEAMSNYFGVSKSDLVEEYSQVSDKQTQLSPKEERDIARQLEATLSELSNPNSALMFDGEPLDDETRELLRASLENQFRMARIIAKEKYTPKKYRKDREDE